MKSASDCCAYDGDRITKRVTNAPSAINDLTNLAGFIRLLLSRKNVKSIAIQRVIGGKTYPVEKYRAVNASAAQNALL